MVKIAYLESNKAKSNKGRIILGECEKVADKFKWAIPYDFTITLYQPNILTLTDEQVKIVLFHELLHVRIEAKEDGEAYFVKPHDIEDFDCIVSRYGLKWAEEKKIGNWRGVKSERF